MPPYSFFIAFLAIFIYLSFQMNLRSFYQGAKNFKRRFGILFGMTLNLHIYYGEKWHLYIIESPIEEHGMCLHFLGSSFKSAVIKFHFNFWLILTQFYVLLLLWVDTPIIFLICVFYFFICKKSCFVYIFYWLLLIF